MTVVSAVAGPSRLPFNTICHSVRRLPLRQTPCCSSRQASTTTALDDPSTAEGESAVNDDGDGSMTGYRRWLDKTGRQYQNVRKGQQAIWLGGRVPFPANPSFRPPAPLSNDLQGVIYDQLRSGSTVAQLSHRYNISKARVEAIRKLKDVEREFHRQKLPVQDAFLSGMEDLLGVRSPLNPKSKTIDAARERDETTSRALHPSSNVERVEEDRWEAGIGRGGAFGHRTSQVEREGLERTVWEFRDEETEMRERKAASSKEIGDRDGVRQAVQEVAAAQAGSDTPEAHRIASELANPPSQSTQPIAAATPSAKAGKYTFVNVSGQGKWKAMSSRKNSSK